MTSERAYLRRISADDQAEVLALAQHGRDLHAPWLAPPRTARAFAAYVRRAQREDCEGLLVCLQDNDEIAGVINVNDISRGPFLSATLGYYVSVARSGQGYMTEGLNLVKQYAFCELGLHRLEANIQPGNAPSIALVRRCGFQREGISKAFLFIDGAWRDHERWAVLDPRAALARNAGWRRRSVVR